MSCIYVLGGGRVGSAIALTLSKSYEVTILDIDAGNFKKLKNRKLKFVQCDFLNKKDLIKKIRPADLIVGAIPGFMGYQVVQTIIETKKNMVDISFFPEDGLKLNSLARKNKVTVAIDCGVAPGMDNILLGYHDARMKVTDFACYVGGLPQVKNHPFNYKATFSPLDVLEEYTRPARFVQNGKLTTKKALTDLEHLAFDGMGTLEAFNSDGLRSLIKTMKHIPNMVEKTLRYPGHAAQMELLREIGLFDKNKIILDKQWISPLRFTSSLLFNHWKFKPGEKDITVMRVIIKGIENNTSVTYTYDVCDPYDDISGTSSMARTTGLTACAVAQLILSGKLSYKGVLVPEMIGADKVCFDFIMEYMKENRIEYKVKKTIS